MNLRCCSTSIPNSTSTSSSPHSKPSTSPAHEKPLHTLEISEAQKKIRLESLEKVADALDCNLVYALVPRDTLHNHYRNRARKITTARIRSVENTMELENQAVKRNHAQLERKIENLIKEDRVNWRLYL